MPSTKLKPEEMSIEVNLWKAELLKDRSAAFASQQSARQKEQAAQVDKYRDAGARLTRRIDLLNLLIELMPKPPAKKPDAASLPAGATGPLTDALTQAAEKGKGPDHAA